MSIEINHIHNGGHNNDGPVTLCGAVNEWSRCSLEVYLQYVDLGEDVTMGFCKKCVERVPLFELADADLNGTGIPLTADLDAIAAIWAIQRHSGESDSDLNTRVLKAVNGVR